VKERGSIFLSALFLSSQSDETGKCKKGKEAFSPLLNTHLKTAISVAYEWFLLEVLCCNNTLRGFHANAQFMSARGLAFIKLLKKSRCQSATGIAAIAMGMPSAKHAPALASESAQ
jgi:hypothetical protein